MTSLVHRSQSPSSSQKSTMRPQLSRYPSGGIMGRNFNKLRTIFVASMALVALIAVSWRNTPTNDELDIASFVMSMYDQKPSLRAKRVDESKRPTTTHKSTAAVDPPKKYKQTDRQVRKLDLANKNATYLSNCLQNNGPVPVILMSLGRSGSSAIWQVASNLTGEETNSDEVPGQNTEQAHYFFKQAGMDHSWLLSRMCQQQEAHPSAGIVGFKWKPNMAIHDHKPAKAALSYIAKSKKPRIKILRSKRNLLDVLVSREKHDSLFDANVRAAHCQKGDMECLKAHQKTAGSGVYMKTDLLLARLKSLTEQEQVVDDILRQNNIDHLLVSYDELFYSPKDKDGVLAWEKVFDFLGSHKRPKHITMKLIDDSMSMASTSSSRDHRNILQNFDEVAAALHGTEFFHLLRSETPIAAKTAR